MKKKILVLALVLLGIMMITSGVAYAIFSYTSEGSSENTIRTGNIVFHYDEVSGRGRGINLVDALPSTDQEGKGQTSYFDFDITAATVSNIGMPYTVTARLDPSSTLDPNVVKIWISDQNNNEVVEQKIFGGLSQYSGIDVADYTEKVVYQGQVPSNTSNYAKHLRARIWIDYDTDFTDGSYNNKTFKITFNVYSTGGSLTQEQIDLEESTDLSTFLVNHVGVHYDETNDVYRTGTGIDTATLELVPDNPESTVVVEQTDSTYTNVVAMNNNIQRLATSINTKVNINNPKTYFKITVTPQRGEQKIYKLEVNEINAGLYDINYNVIADWNTLKTTYGLLDDLSNLKTVLENGALSAGTILRIDGSGDIDSIYLTSNIKDLIVSGNIKSLTSMNFAYGTIVENLTFEEGFIKLLGGNKQGIGAGIAKNISVPSSLNISSMGTFIKAKNMTTKLYDCPNYENLYHYDNGYYLGNSDNPYVFLLCIDSGITTLNIHSNTKIIGSYIQEVIYNGTTKPSISSITIPDSVTYIGRQSLKSINSITMGNGVERIADRGMSGSIYNKLPNNLEDFISSQSFGTQIQSDYGTEYGNAIYKGSEENPYMFLISATSTDVTSINIHPNTKFIYQNAFKNCTSLTEIVIPGGITFIDKNAFSGCTNLTDIRFVDSTNWYKSSSFDRIEDDFITTKLVDLSDSSTNLSVIRTSAIRKKID